MITCPNCGQPVREGQMFCGACGSDVQAAASAAGLGRPPGEEETSPYAYSQQPSYGYETPPSGEAPTGNSRTVVLIVVALLAACCIFACGLAFGFEIIPDLLGIGTSSAPKGPPVPTPTPISLDILRMYLHWFA